MCYPSGPSLSDEGNYRNYQMAMAGPEATDLHVTNHLRRLQHLRAGVVMGYCGAARMLQHGCSYLMCAACGIRLEGR